ncbi:MAG: ABC transporter ATP-binding protein [Elusimicrobia bacterium]|nr:ABC transporter ATP-binding protein [Elusimicrobiota bacterium]
MKALVEAVGLGKRFRHTLPRYHTLFGRLRHAAAGGAVVGERWALRGVSFSVGPGECLGVVGPNGAGKTTLLRLAAHILEPTEGSVVVRGRPSCLLQLHAGLQPELSVRDNVELGAVLMGLSRREARGRTPEVLRFAGLSEAAEVRAAELSAGQLARLGFSTALHSDLDVLLVDEALTVGDAEFRARCLDAFGGLLRDGKCVLVATHDLEPLKALGARVLELRAGRVAEPRVGAAGPAAVA